MHKNLNLEKKGSHCVHNPLSLSIEKVDGDKFIRRM